MKKNRRKKYIIEGNFQTRFILRFVLVIVGATLLSAGALLGVFYLKYQYGEADFQNLIIMVSPEGTTDVASLFQVVLVPILVANLLILCIIIPYSLIYSHKIAGPIYRLEQSLDFLLKGEMDFIIVLRRKDEFKYLANKMNALIDYMRRNIGEVRLSYRMIQERAVKIQNMVKTPPVDIESLNMEIMELSRFFKERGKPFSY
jgi:methyl-accepting chemotaxis protein